MGLLYIILKCSTTGARGAIVMMYEFENSVVDLTVSSSFGLDMRACLLIERSRVDDSRRAADRESHLGPYASDVIGPRDTITISWDSLF